MTLTDMLTNVLAYGITFKSEGPNKWFAHHVVAGVYGPYPTHEAAIRDVYDQLVKP